MSNAILHMTGISKKFGPLQVLRETNFDLYAGEVHALMGENGAGKSTLMKILTGMYQADGGRIQLFGNKVRFTNPREAMQAGLAMIHQELSPVLDLTVAENIFLGREPRYQRVGLLSIIKQSDIFVQAQQLLDEIGGGIRATRLMRHLTIAEMQLVEIIKAISQSAKILVMDEPTSALSDKEVAHLFSLIDDLKRNGVAIVYISHRMDEIFKIADRITVLRDGEYKGTRLARDTNIEELIRLMVGREIKDYYPRKTTPRGEVILQVENLSHARFFHNISFSLRRGEILGIAGLMGAGRTELVESIFGIHHASSGAVKIHNRRIKVKSPLDAIRQKMALVPEDRKRAGLNLSATVRENVSMVKLKDLNVAGVVRSREEARQVEQYIHSLRIKVSSANARVSSLSGGNQQKVVLAKWLLTEPEVIIFDEPTRGIDIGAKQEIYALMVRLASQGKGIIMISSEMPEVMGISDRIIVLAEGKLTGELSREHFSQENIMRLAAPN